MASYESTILLNRSRQLTQNASYSTFTHIDDTRDSNFPTFTSFQHDASRYPNADIYLDLNANVSTSSYSVTLALFEVGGSKVAGSETTVTTTTADSSVRVGPFSLTDGARYEIRITNSGWTSGDWIRINAARICYEVNVPEPLANEWLFQDTQNFQLLGFNATESSWNNKYEPNNMYTRAFYFNASEWEDTVEFILEHEAMLDSGEVCEIRLVKEDDGTPVDGSTVTLENNTGRTVARSASFTLPENGLYIIEYRTGGDQIYMGGTRMIIRDTQPNNFLLHHALPDWHQKNITSATYGFGGYHYSSGRYSVASSSFDALITLNTSTADTTVQLQFLYAFGSGSVISGSASTNAVGEVQTVMANQSGSLATGKIVGQLNPGNSTENAFGGPVLRYKVNTFATGLDITTKAATNVQQTSATGNASIEQAPNDITERGFNYGENSLNQSVRETGTFSTGSYSLQLTDLNPGSEYQVQAYAVDSQGKQTANEVTLTTPPGPPYLQTFINVVQVGYNFAIIKGRIRNDGGENLNLRGIVLSKNSQPAPGSVPIDQSGYELNVTETGSFPEEDFNGVPALEPNTTYYYRSYGRNSYGHSYGAESSFTTPDYAVFEERLPFNADSYRPLIYGNDIGDSQYGSQSFIGQVNKIDSVTLRLKPSEIAESGGNTRVLICTDDADGRADTDNPIYTSNTKNIDTNKNYTFLIDLEIDSGTRYHVVIDATQMSDGEGIEYGYSNELGSTEENSFVYNGSWAEAVDRMAMTVSGTIYLPPKVTTGDAVNIGDKAATLKGDVTNAAGQDITTRGVEYSKDTQT